MSSTERNMEKINKLALDTLRLSRNTLLVNLRFLDMALSCFDYIPLPGSIAVDGEHIYYNPVWVLKRYMTGKEVIARDYLHMVMHCIFHHSFVNTLVDKDAWNLACDMAVENAITGLNLSIVRTNRETEQISVLNKFAAKVKHLTAEKIYYELRDGNYSHKEIARMQQVFQSDIHDIWYLPQGNDDDNSMDSEKNRQNCNQQQGQKNKNRDNNQSQNSFDSQTDLQPGLQSIVNISDSLSEHNAPGQQENHTGMSRSALEEMWNDIAQRMQTDLETFSRQQGTEAGDLTQNLLAVTREKYDYTEFLKRFSVMGEVMKVNDDEFDYIFYTYGLKLYDKMPLIEPLEYKEVKRIKEFVIAIDTSGSVSGDLVQRFLQKTYNILKQQESFFTKINLHLIQCDAEIQQDLKITSQEEFDEAIKHLTLRGFGGTDFRPVFRYVDELRRKKEFTNLKGLIYFTDGYGDFPVYKPDYHTAFVFIDDDYGNPDVPVWAIKLVLPSEDI